MSTQEIVIKQYRSTGRCVVRSGGILVADVRSGELNRRLQSATIPLMDKREQFDAVLEVMGDYGYELSRYGRDDYGNTLLTFAPVASVKKAA